MAEAATLTDTTPTTTGTGTQPGAGLEKGTSLATTNTNEPGLGAVIGDGTKPLSSTVSEGKPSESAPPPVDKPLAGAPEKYEAWKVPEGYELDAGLVEEASPIFRKAGLSQEQTQELVDFYAKHSIKSAEEVAAANNKAFWDARRAWREELKNDDMTKGLVGTDGNHGPDSPLIKTISEAMIGLQNPKLVQDFKAAMELTGAGDHPAFVKVLYSLAKQVTEGTSYANGGVPKPDKERPKSAAAAIFPHLPSAYG
jgi:hypothetical protein